MGDSRDREEQDGDALSGRVKEGGGEKGDELARESDGSEPDEAVWVRREMSSETERGISEANADGL
jgi:hypothetical protein